MRERRRHLRVRTSTRIAGSWHIAANKGAEAAVDYVRRGSKKWWGIDAPFKLVGKVAGAGGGVEATDKEDARHVG